MIKRAVIYARVSTTEQELKNQLNAIQQFADGRYHIVEIYTEEESTWKAGHQIWLKQLMKDARAGKFKVVLVWSLDRLTRGGALAILSLVHRLGSHGVRVISLQEPWTEAPGELAELLYAIAGWAAKMESQRISERTKAGLSRAAQQGHYPGRPKGAKDTKRRKKRVTRRPAWEV